MLGQQNCVVCERAYLPIRSTQRCCSHGCEQERRGGRRRERPCEVCTKIYHACMPEQRTCSRDCGMVLRLRLNAERRMAKPPKPDPMCVVCDAPFVRRGNAKFCSDRCRLQRASDQAGVHATGLYSLACRGGMGGATWRGLLVRYLRERDGDRCQICRRNTIRFDLKSGPRGDDRGPSIDHLVPRSLGGEDDLANLRLAHWACNRRRKNHSINEQLMLIG